MHDGMVAPPILQRSVSAYIGDASTDRRTLAELRALPIDSLLDLNIDRSELATIARREVYGC